MILSKLLGGLKYESMQLCALFSNDEPQVMLPSNVDLWDFGNELFTQRQTECSSAAAWAAVPSGRGTQSELMVCVRKLLSETTSNSTHLTFSALVIFQGHKSKTSESFGHPEIINTQCCHCYIIDVFLHWKCLGWLDITVNRQLSKEMWNYRVISVQTEIFLFGAFLHSAENLQNRQWKKGRWGGRYRQRSD